MSTHASLQKKQCLSFEGGSEIGRKEAVFAVCLQFDTDVNEVTQHGSIIKEHKRSLTLLCCAQQAKKGRRISKANKINDLPDVQ